MYSLYTLDEYHEESVSRTNPVENLAPLNRYKAMEFMG